jgi:hypothetical protein
VGPHAKGLGDGWHPQALRHWPVAKNCIDGDALTSIRSRHSRSGVGPVVESSHPVP